MTKSFDIHAMRWSLIGAVVSCSLLAGCAAPAPITHQPMSVRPAPEQRTSAGASLYSDATFKSLFEDARARHVGDVLTIVIAESNTASKKSSTDASRKSSLTSGGSSAVLQSLAALGNNSYSFAGAGDAAMTNAFAGNISVTVIDVYPNGNLLVSGEKQVSINHGNEFVRFSGVVPGKAIIGNSVTSTHVADAKLEFRQDGALDATQTQGWLARFFLSISLF